MEKKDCTICPWKFPEICPGVFGRMVSAHFVWWRSHCRRRRGLLKLPNSVLKLLYILEFSPFTDLPLFNCLQEFKKTSSGRAEELEKWTNGNL